MSLGERRNVTHFSKTKDITVQKIQKHEMQIDIFKILLKKPEICRLCENTAKQMQRKWERHNKTSELQTRIRKIKQRTSHALL